MEGIEQNPNSTSTTSTEASGGNPASTRKRRSKSNEPMGADLGSINNDPKSVNIIAGENVPPQPAPREKKPKKKASVKKDDTINDVTVLLEALTGVAAGLMQNPIWQYEKSECQSIARPLVNILERYDLLEKMSNASDGVMLITAVLVSTAPRVMLQIQQNKNESRAEHEQPTTTTSPATEQSGQTKNNDSRGSKGNDGNKQPANVSGGTQLIKDLSTANY